ncbi:MAG: SDR family NAD(P)-dependent oxidoreductase [Calditrichae bacterium]|nr:SDR family NAD(P)-dependent oxidoreductase [Calditrichia bacterium]
MEYNSLAVISGASRGIGAAVARKLAEQGMGVVLLARSKDALENVAGYLQSEGLVAHPFAVDLSVSSELDAMVDFVKNIGVEVKLVVHSAGIARVGTVEEMSLADWRRVIDVNLTAPFMFSQKMIPVMKAGSQFIFINSVAGKQSFPEWAAYSASKHGLKALADTLRQEVADRGIRVTTLYPTSVDTMLHNDLPYDWDRKKMLKPRDVADAVLYLMRQPAHITINEMDMGNIAGTF